MVECVRSKTRSRRGSDRIDGISEVDSIRYWWKLELSEVGLSKRQGFAGEYINATFNDKTCKNR